MISHFNEGVAHANVPISYSKRREKKPCYSVLCSLCKACHTMTSPCAVLIAERERATKRAFERQQTYVFTDLCFLCRGEQLDPLLIVFYSVGFVLAVCLSLGGYIYAKRALRDLKARALAREQVLTAFSFPELDEYDDLDSPTAVERQASARLLDKRQQLELSAFTSREERQDSGRSSPSEEETSRRSSGDRLLSSIREEPVKAPSGSSASTNGKKAAGDSETRLVADSRGAHSDEESDLV